MTLIEILLLVLGFVFVCLSFLLGERTQTDTNPSSEAKTMWDDKDEERIKERVNQVVEDQIEDLVIRAKDQMSTTCNEKIMAVDEFSTQILEKIDANHKEVVFMYNMLSEKEKEMKAPKKQQPVKRVAEAPKPKKVSNQPVKEDVKVVVPMGSNNEKIMDLHKKGKTILEISKALNMGQGEVKLVIDLYGRK